jgi:3',5'-cyclic-AMP phosphodiesterase
VGLQLSGIGWPGCLEGRAEGCSAWFGKPRNAGWGSINYPGITVLKYSVRAAVGVIAALIAASFWAGGAPAPFHFVILGDRTGEVQPGVYEQVWRQASSANPAFFVSVGDSIQGLDDAAAEAEWRQFERILQPFQRYALYLAAGNHDIWSPRSEELFRKYAKHPPHYSFDYGAAHFTILDNSRSDVLVPDEMTFLEGDLREHAAQLVKFVISHRPSWLIDAAFGNANFPFHQLMKKYGVKYVIAGHVHQMLHVRMDGVTYLSMPSAGGHLRLSEKYEDGWFFGYTAVEVNGTDAGFRITELKAPHGQGRVTRPEDWGASGLVEKGKAQAAKGP